MKVLVCGSRHFKDKELMEDVLKEYVISEIIHGNARGADTLAGEYAQGHGIPCVSFPADWELYGKAAGPIRNTEMLTKGQPDFVIAFRAKDSKGTQNMIDQAIQAGIMVKVVDVE